MRTERVGKMNNRIKSIEGLRAISIIFVILYHLMPHVFEGGYIGVVVFFVLSGYFMADNMLFDLNENQEFHFFEFLKKRLIKLYRSYLPFLCIVSLTVLFFYHEALGNFTYNLLSSLFGINNIYQILNGLSYFDNYGNINPFTHLWFMGVEIQFYLIFPILLLGLYKLFGGHRIQIGFVLFAISIFSALLMYVNFIPDSDISRIYYGTDTRAFSFLIGAIFATVFPKEKILNLDISMGLSIFYTFVSGIFGGILIFCMIYIKSDFSLLYPFGMYGLSLISGVLSVLLLIRKNYLAKLLSIPIFTIIGKRSYSLYLWQYSVMVFVNYEFLWSKISKWRLFGVNLAITFIISEIAYQLFEKKWEYSEKISFYKKRFTILFSLLGMISVIFVPIYMPEKFVFEDDMEELKQRFMILDANELKEEEDFRGTPEIVLKKSHASDTNIPDHADVFEIPDLQKNHIFSNSDTENHGIYNEVALELQDEENDEEIKQISESSNLEKIPTDQESNKNANQVSEDRSNDVNQESQNQINHSKPIHSDVSNEEKIIENKENGENASDENSIKSVEHNSLKNKSEDVQVNSTNEVKIENVGSSQNEDLSQQNVEKPTDANNSQETSKPVEEKPQRYTFIGDSVMLGSKPSIQQAFPNCYVNAKVSRQSWHLSEVLSNIENEGKLYENIIIHLGTNGYIDKSKFIGVLKRMGDRKIYLINTVVPRSWEESVNSVIKEVASELPNVQVIDWYSLAKGKKQWFYKDAVHPNSNGISEYTNLIKNSVK